ncbi:MAG TPA: arsenite methyltransferase [Streptosporangiaceae bacterium]|nr:arsenite methyltransferase [Streptosporangiaceae bacterium]
MTRPDELDEVRERVRARYAAAATAVTQGGVATCGDTRQAPDETGTGSELYSAAEQDGLPGDAVAASLGCGNPLAVAELRAGETVLDLGSGGGIDVLLSARRVGPSGQAYGLDMTGEMLDLARANAADAGAVNVELLAGHIEAIPLPDAAVDVIISNCVINLSTDKQAVFAESWRVLRPGGRFGVSDILAGDELSEAERRERGRPVGCLAGVLSFGEYRDALARAGFTGISITPTHEVAAGLQSAIVQAVKPDDSGR